MIYWITGRAGSGKTTLAKKMMADMKNASVPAFVLNQYEKMVLLDGDDVRKWFPAGYSDEERHAHIMRVARFAALLEDQGFTVFIALVSPKKEWRMEARSLFQKSRLIYLPGGTLWPGTTYEEPDEEEIQHGLGKIPALP